ncbi:pyridoxamine 5'-phosphate oxidase family protein [Desulfonatronovibrio magnus]|uniref:pyridoxamine 5'-phosphate oxidase family protein n=1 Tax=Desulfonatronovibrio magnus TaxID=698827 RepID=UPI0005EB6BCD|nr:pyridoxamine 5'-phosphate oxidase family protein [Desulfonatronovibrio magnus]
MQDIILKIMKQNDLAVLTTSTENQPHCSLMAFICDDKGHNIFMLTQKDSSKFRNISANPKVAVMIDTRTQSPDRSSIKALTVKGTCSPAQSIDQDTLKEQLLKQHPQLQGLAAQRDAIILQIKAESFLLLDGVSDAYFMECNC